MGVTARNEENTDVSQLSQGHCTQWDVSKQAEGKREKELVQPTIDLVEWTEVCRGLRRSSNEEALFVFFLLFQCLSSPSQSKAPL